MKRGYCYSWIVYCWTLSCFASTVRAEGCPPSEAILPCRCSLRGAEIQIWCSHSNLPQIMDGLKSVERNIKSPIDELVLENNQLPALPGRFFGSLQIVRLMLRYNSIERLSNGWLNDLENSLVEIYIVEPQLRSIPVESLNGMIKAVAITIQSDELKRLPDFSGLLSLNYLSVQGKSLTELVPLWFRHLPQLQNIHITGGPHLNRLEAGLFDSLIALKNVDLSRNGLNWIHLRALSRLPNLVNLKLSHNQFSDVAMIGRIVKDLENLKKIRLDHNLINVVEDGSFVDLPHLSELHLNDNRITEIQYGAFLRVPMLKTIYLHNNHIKRIHPECFLQASGSGVEVMYIYNNEIEEVSELRSLLEALPALRFLDFSNNLLRRIHFGDLRGHGTIEQLHLNNNLLKSMERDALMAMPALRELRLRNNSLSHELPKPLWNLPGLKGLDLSLNNFRSVDSFLLAGLPSLRRLDLSENGLSQLDPSTFIHNPMLETLNISTNELISVHPATFRNLDRLFEVDVSFNQLEELIPGLPKIVERVSVRGNLIETLANTPGQALDLPNLRMLDLSSNRLEHLPKYGFQGAPQLRVLSLAGNRLRSLDEAVFSGARRLELLHLQENQLALLDERAFLPLSELRNLNLHSNQLQTVSDNLFSNNSRLEQLDLSHNIIGFIAQSAFESQRSLEYLDLSNNALSDMSTGLSNLQSLRDVDLSYNQITQIPAAVVSSWRRVVEIRLSNNLIAELKRGTFRNLPKLQYLDLSSNEISSVEPGALKHLPDLQELVLADNKLVDLKERVFEDLPNLLAAHFQYNSLRSISSQAFFNSPSVVFLNLSNNNFRFLENVGVRSMRNLEVLDLSQNKLKAVSTQPLRALSWLVELKMDDNEICQIQGSPFENMPRLRVLSMRNNRLRTFRERTFRNLRGNIAILDVDGNPINCSCEMQWLSAWLQETNSPYPGPRCQDGRLLRVSRIDKDLCVGHSDTSHRTGGLFDSSNADDNLPLLNDHGDVFEQQLNRELNDGCGVYELPPGERPLVGESEYFYDQYVDFTPGNDTASQVGETPSPSPHSGTSNPALSPPKKPPLPTASVGANIDLNNTILNTKYFKKRPGQVPPSSSPFTFFGYPIPSLSLGRFFGLAKRGRKDRGEKGIGSSISRSTGTPPMTTQASRGKVRMYQPNSAEFEKYLKSRNDSEDGAQYGNVNARTRFLEAASDEGSASKETTTGGFKTGFRVPAAVERGGFRPMLPERAVGGFVPVHDPQKRRGVVEVVAPAATGSTDEAEHSHPIALKNATTPAINVTRGASSIEIEAQTSNVTETPPEETTSERRGTPSPLETTTRTTSKRMYTTTTTTTTTTTPTVVTEAPESELDLEVQSVNVPPPLESTTAETILLIPPPEEHVEQVKRQSWVFTTPALNQLQDEPITTAATISSPRRAATTFGPSRHLPRPGGPARSTITKVYTPQTLNHYLPTAEEYHRTTPSGGADTMRKHQHQITADAQKREDNLDRVDRKDGMDWYYESFRKTRTPSGAGKQLSSGGLSSLRSVATPPSLLSGRGISGRIELATLSSILLYYFQIFVMI